MNIFGAFWGFILSIFGLGGVAVEDYAANIHYNIYE